MTSVRPAARLSVLPLLGCPYAEADCAAIARGALQLAGVEVPDYAFARFGRDSAEALAAYLEATGPWWTELGSTASAAAMLGDVIVSVPPGGGPHLSVLMDEVARVAVTTSRATGCQCIRVARIRGIVRVIRWTP